MDNPFPKTNRAAVIIEHLELCSGMSVLDAGCGPGRLSVPVARQVCKHGKVVAMDIQHGMLQRAREKERHANMTNLDFVQAGIGEHELGHNQFDRALLATVLGEIPDREAALKEIYYALKPGGLLSIAEIIFDPHFQGRHTVARLAEAAGFREK